MEADNRTEWPFVSVIMPVRNEASFIENTVNSILNNDYPPNKMEVIIVDGMSDDGTREIVEKIAAKDNRITMIDNAKKTVPFAMNAGLRRIKGDYFTRVDGHAQVAPDFIKNSIRCLFDKEEAWVVGGYIETVSATFIGKAISAAMQSPVGVGNAMFRRGDYEGWVDTLAFGMHHRWILDKIGLFDEQLARNQDDDFNFRIIQAGGKIWLSKKIKSVYYSRSSLKTLWRQYYQYGFWRIRTIQKHGQPATLRQLAPVLLVLSLLTLGVLGLFHPVFIWLLIGETAVYLAGLLAGAVDVARKSSLRYALVAPAIFVILHFGYGLGSLWGIVNFILLRGRGQTNSQDYRLSR